MPKTNPKKIALVSSLVGIFALLLCIILDLSYPNPAFSILGVIGLIGVFLAAFTYLIIYIRDVADAYKKKDKITLTVLVIVGLIFAIFYYLRLR